MDLGSGGVASTPQGDSVTGWLAVCDTLDAKLSALRARLDCLAECGLPGSVSVSVRHIPDADWLTEWRKYHHAMNIGRRLTIVPSWEAFSPSDGRQVVLLDPGMAFGTGSHPSTRLCLEALEQVVEPDMDVIDVGTGSGILAIAAVRLGARRVLASEIDALPRKIAAENAARNGVADRVEVITPEELAERRPTADVVVCNIIAETIAELAPLLAAMVRPDGMLITSGIVEERLSVAVDALERHALSIVEVRCDDVWRAVIACHARTP